MKDSRGHFPFKEEEKMYLLKEMIIVNNYHKQAGALFISRWFPFGLTDKAEASQGGLDLWLCELKGRVSMWHSLSDRAEPREHRLSF